MVNRVHAWSFGLALASGACFAQTGGGSRDAPTVQENSACGPIYPAVSRRLGEAGVVFVKAFVEADGIPSQVDIERSSGFARLDKSAMDAVTCFRFRPGRIEGVPSAMWVRVPIRFDLR
ncbi:energy transducer TonB [Ramlibacter tataouinensis]|uniref:energy transducer TonB n=1 Tax=Ramlibacter tataouinensis TaxID=94132 RepID=UPI0022F3A684|nr:energy transducer TonB [Ramlibacter tataouinensis]WBY02403.1 energy transducer TonB [Ramlibacter tataouinensis]